MKWHKTSEILPQTNKQLLLLLKGCAGYSYCYDMPFTNVVMGVYLKNETPNKQDSGALAEEECYFEALCCEISLPPSQIIAWSYVPSVAEIEESLLMSQ